MEGIEQPNQKRIRTLREKKNYKYLGIVEVDTIKLVEIEEKIQKEYLRWMIKLLKTNFCSRNLIKRINTRAVLGETLKNEPEDKKVDDNAQDLTSKR